MRNDLKLISMEDVQAKKVQWLWYPYIPLGKLTIVQCDPGEGKTTFVLAVVAALTRGEALPESEQARAPMSVIYQTAEDGLADTIKPRLEASGADCTRVLVIDESKRELTLCDDRLEQAVHRAGARLIVLDPIQAYLGDGVDMHRANEVRPVLKCVAAMAERTGCAVILIGHMNKAQGLKSGYRGLGSIDFRAAARSVLVVGRLKEDPTVRIVAQDKNSLPRKGGLSPSSWMGSGAFSGRVYANSQWTMCWAAAESSRQRPLRWKRSCGRCFRRLYLLKRSCAVQRSWAYRSAR